MTRPNRAVGYRAVIRLPGVLRVFPAAVLGRLSYATFSLSLLLAVEHATASFAATGAALGAYALASLPMPAKARLIDRFGQRRVLPLLSAAFAAVLVGIAAAAWAGVSSPAVYVALTAVAGLAAAPLGSSMRALWAALTPEPAARQRAYSLDGVVEETLYAVGPLLVGIVIAVSDAVAAVVLTAILNLIGTLAMAASPAAAAHAPPGPRPARSSWLGPLGIRGFTVLLGALFGIGLGGGPLEVSVVARAQAAGRPGVAGSLFAVLSVGSVVGGLLWGRLDHRRVGSAQLAGLVAVMALGAAAAGLSPGLVVLAVVLFAAGSVSSPAFTVAYLAADELVTHSGRTEATTWVSTANNVGNAVGAAAAGVVIDRVSADAALTAGAVVLAATAIALRATGSAVDRREAPR